MGNLHKRLDRLEVEMPKADDEPRYTYADMLQSVDKPNHLATAPRQYRNGLTLRQWGDVFRSVIPGAKGAGQ